MCLWCGWVGGWVGVGGVVGRGAQHPGHAVVIYAAGPCVMGGPAGPVAAQMQKMEELRQPHPPRPHPPPPTPSPSPFPSSPHAPTPFVPPSRPRLPCCARGRADAEDGGAEAATPTPPPPTPSPSPSPSSPRAPAPSFPPSRPRLPRLARGRADAEDGGAEAAAGAAERRGGARPALAVGAGGFRI